MGRMNTEDQKAYSLRISAGLKFEALELTAADNFVLDEDAPPLIFLDAAGAIDVLLPESTPARKGLTFIVFNVSASTITFKSSADAAFTTAIALATLEGTILVCTGHATAALGWRAIGTALSS